MPPKKGGAGGAGSKVTVDKTFGMKNKKGSKAQQQIKVVQQQQQQAGKSKEQLAKEKQREAEKKAKAEAEKRKKEELELFAIVQPKVPFGVDPKTVTCEFWKHGRCDKSATKCKYAHSNDAGRKVEKKDIYTDMRDGDNKKTDTMDKWDEEKLQKVVTSKHGNPKTTTDIICKYFLEAVGNNSYGWFWDCPNGNDKCHYRHALPPGYKLKSQKKDEEELEKKDEISIEEFLDVARHQLGKDLTPLTKESFAVWKAARVARKAAQEEAEQKARAQQAARGKLTGLSGKDLWSLNPEMVGDDDDDGGQEFDIRDYLKAWKAGNQQVEDDEDKAQSERLYEPSDAGTDAAEGSVSGKVAKLSVNGDA